MFSGNELRRRDFFQNYRAKFTILDTGTVSREWIEAVRIGDPLHPSAPAAWRKWIEKGVYEPLTAEPTIEYRTREEQQPAAGRDESLVQCIYGYFKDNPHGFEHCAARLAGLMDANIKIETVTRPSVAGARMRLARVTTDECACVHAGRSA
jgi:hypothetical protein